jgi:hypothetical protein
LFSSLSACHPRVTAYLHQHPALHQHIGGHGFADTLVHSREKSQLIAYALPSRPARVLGAEGYLVIG